MPPIANPYIAGNPVTGEAMFFGRRDVFAWVQNNLIGQHQDHALVVHGERRTGKTSLLYQMRRHLPPTYLPVLIDLQALSMNGLGQFIWDLAYTIQRTLSREYSIDLPRLDRQTFLEHPREQFEETLLEALEGILGERHVLLMFDEAHLLQEQVSQGMLEPEVFAFLTHLMRDYPFLNFLFVSGAKLQTMQREFADLFQAALYHEISFLDRDDAIALVVDPAAETFDYDIAALNRILTITSGHPYYTQLLCHALFNRWAITQAPTVTAADVEAVLDETVEACVANLRYTWDSSTPEEQIALSALAECAPQESAPVTRRQVEDMLRTHNVTLGRDELTAALRGLAVRDIIPAQEPYLFRVDLLRRWLRQRRQMTWAVEELGPQIAQWATAARARSRKRPFFLRPLFWAALIVLVLIGAGAWGIRRAIDARNQIAALTATAQAQDVAAEETRSAATAIAVATADAELAAQAGAVQATAQAIEAATLSAIQTATAQPTPTPTSTATPTRTQTPTPSSTPTDTVTPTPPPTSTPTITPTPLPTLPPTATATQLPTPIPTATPIPVPPTPTPLPVGGGKIVYYREGKYWTSDTSGLNEKQLNVPNYGVVFSPDGRRAVWGGQQDGLLTVANYDGSSPVGLAQPGRLGDWRCIPGENWSPDGTRIAFLSGWNQSREILIASASTGAVTPLTSNWYDDDVPRWSPNSQMIAFLGNDTVQRDQWFLHVGWADGSGQWKAADRLVHRSDFSAEFSWNASSTEIAISTEQEPKKWVIYAIRATGGGERYVIEKFTERLMDVHWSPDGSKIVYATLRYDEETVGTEVKKHWFWDFFLVNADGSGDRYLLTLPGEDKNWRSIKWSPDSQWVAIYDCNQLGGAGGAQLILQNVNGGTLNYTINQVVGAPFGPVWSYDKRKLLMNTMDGIYVSDLNGGNRYLLVPYAAIIGWLP